MMGYKCGAHLHLTSWLHGVMPGTVGSAAFFAGEFMRERKKKEGRREEGVTINANKTGRRAGSRRREGGGA